VREVRLRPEEGEEGVPAAKAGWRGGGQVGQKREPPRLRDEVSEVAPVRRGCVQSPEELEDDHRERLASAESR
jgi:hypothetical protein